MALINCPECNKSISENAKTCPHCGEPIVLDSLSNGKKNVKKRKVKKINPSIYLIIFVIVCIGAFSVYKKNMSQEEKDIVNQFASSIGISKVIPWSERAVTAAIRLVNNYGSIIAGNIQRIGHPTGKNATLGKYEVTSSSDVITVKFYIDFKSGLLGNSNRMVIEWLFTKNRTIAVNIIHDTSIIPVIIPFRKEIENYCKTSLYGEVLKNI